MGGDLNEILMSDDKFGGRIVNINRALRFRDCLDNCKMLDIGFTGPRSTWSNRRPLTQLIQERIDRVFINIKWNVLFPEAIVKHLERIHSDHCPIMLSLVCEPSIRLTRPFKFQPMWLSHPDFTGVVSDIWSEARFFSSAVTRFEAKAKDWNKKHFGNILHRKNKIRARLRDVQTTLANKPNEFLVNLDNTLRAEYLEVCKLEEDFWVMKACISRLVEGNRNTAFFHASALVRCRRNRISRMKDRMGNWLEGDREIAEYIRNGFLELFSTNQCSAPLLDWYPPFWQVSLLADDAKRLASPITNSEIRFALWSLKPYKAPGPDGLHVGFFQHLWHIMGDSVKDEVKLVFSLGMIPEYLNKTLITLIPSP